MYHVLILDSSGRMRPVATMSLGEAEKVAAALSDVAGHQFLVHVREADGEQALVSERYYGDANRF